MKLSGGVGFGSCTVFLRNKCGCRCGAQSSRPLPSASRRRSGSYHFRALLGEWNLPSHLFGETPNRATETVALPFSDCSGWQKSEGRRRWEKRFATPEMFQQTMRDYYRLVTGIDREVGRIVARLSERGLADNTVIYLAADPAQATQLKHFESLLSAARKRLGAPAELIGVVHGGAPERQASNKRREGKSRAGKDLTRK